MIEKALIPTIAFRTIVAIVPVFLVERYSDRIPQDYLFLFELLTFVLMLLLLYYFFGKDKR